MMSLQPPTHSGFMFFLFMFTVVCQTHAVKGTVHQLLCPKQNDLIGNEAESAGCDRKVLRVLLLGPDCD